jgi:hypothetical protein
MRPELDKLASAVTSFTQFVCALPAQTLKPSNTEKWGAREVFVHLVFWHEQYAEIASDLLAGRKHKHLSGTFKEINATAVAQNSSVPIGELLDRWVVAQKRLERLGQNTAASRLKLALREGSKQWPFLVLMRLAAGHIRQHEAKLKKLLGLSKRGRLAAV